MQCIGYGHTREKGPFVVGREIISTLITYYTNYDDDDSDDYYYKNYLFMKTVKR